MSELPPKVRDEVITECYRLAEELDWEALSHRERSQTYDAWLDVESIGGRLTALLSRERARVWLKDVPMKEFARARAGIGSYARFVTSTLTGPDAVAKQALGKDWSAVLSTVQVKPNRVRVVRSEHEDRLMLWGRPEGLRDLVWASLTAIVDDGDSPVVILVSTRARRPTESAQRRHRALGAQAGVEVFHTTISTHRAASTI